MTRAEFLQYAAQWLEGAGIAEPKAEAIFLLKSALKLDAIELLTHGGKKLTADELKTLEQWLTRREKREPLARIAGSRGFWKGEFALNEATLEPRPDSETVIEAALAHAKEPKAILDIGTGTGCLLLSLLQEFPEAHGTATDKSARALEAAKENAASLALDARAAFIETNWADGVNEKFDLIVSNPPYIPVADIITLQPEVKEYDPMLALDGGADGLDAYRALAQQTPSLLNAGGVLVLEIGKGQEKGVKQAFIGSGLKPVESRKDLGNVVRALVFAKAA